MASRPMATRVMTGLGAATHDILTPPP